MQMLQISGVLEIRSHQLRRDSLKLINATICGTATTEFWRLMESYFGIDEDIDEAALEDAQSLADIVAQKKAWAEESVPSVSKESDVPMAAPRAIAVPPSHPEEVVIDDDDEVASVHSAHSSTSAGSLQTLASKKRTTLEKYPSFCNIKSATLFFPTSSDTLHVTGIKPEHITDRKKIGSYRGYYCCAFGDCQYAAQTHGVVATHVRRVHLGHALGCHFCAGQAWWQARYWSNHMDEAHSDQPKYEPLVMPEGPIKAEEVTTENIPEEDHFVVEQSWTYPPQRPAVPVHHTEPKTELPEVSEVAPVHHSSKKRKVDSGDLEELFESH